MNKKLILATGLTALVLTGCAVDGTRYRSDTYYASAVNQAQQVRTVEILAIGSAKVAISNEANRSDGSNIGMILGAIAGAAIGNQSHDHRLTNRVIGGLAGGVVGHMLGESAGGRDSVDYVDGVQLTFRYKDKLYNSAQVGRPCEYKTGLAVMISTSPTETRIQPNNPGACVINQ